ncbi:uncharacterized protein C2845_PM02G03280 [Panicum miliaceum]|uniref:FLZ-type domain-containing protein n=1 Tax=Panicum miliaceum TaxID=4540 RepID=A0A3L6SA94_PANMI|nr:uncharacterized protein C2845_PM02G03280 [Panicum miliaceum]
MLRNRSRRAVGGGAKQGGGAGGLVAEPPAATAAAAQSPRHPSSSAAAAPVFPSPRPFMAMALPQAGLLDGSSEGPSSAMSPTSILETKQFCCSALPPFLSERSLRRAHHVDAAAAPEPAGVGLADVLRDHGDAKLGGGKVVFGSQLRIQVPSGRAVELVSSPIEFGAKNRDAQLAVLSPARRFLPEVVSSPSARVFAGAVAPGEMAMSEDYTCVISRGPNPRTRHIFDDCIVESCGDVLVEKMDKGAGAAVASGFLSSCHTCNKQLGHGNDIFIYRGDKAFCSSECRYQEMLLDEAVDNLR